MRGELNSPVTAAKQQIREEFQPTEEQMEKVEEHLESLRRETPKVKKFEWKRLFIYCITSISMDLGFGLTIPVALFNLFKQLIKELIDYRLKGPGS